jgi:hypothetical protein
MEFASVGSVILPSKPIQLAVEDKLAALRRIDKSRPLNRKGRKCPTPATSERGVERKSKRIPRAFRFGLVLASG